jgi:hypothetical protein
MACEQQDIRRPCGTLCAMIANRMSSSAGARAALPYIALCFLLVSFCVGWNRVKHPGTDYWDARVYSDAIKTWVSGGDPYSTDARLPFLNPPIFAAAGGALSRILPGHLGWDTYLLLTFAAMLSIPWLLSGVYVRSRWMTPAIAFVLFVLQPKLMAVISLLSGNVSNLLYGLVLAAGVSGIRRNRWTWFYAAVVVAGMVKPPFLTLLILPALAGRGQMGRSMLAAAVTAAGYLAQGLRWPEAYSAFRRVVAGKVLVDHTGVGIYNLVATLGERFVRPWGALAIHGLVMGAVLGALFLLRGRSGRPGMEALWVPALLVAAILANPQLASYDEDIALIPAIAICVECMRRRLALGLPVGWVAAPAAFFVLLLCIQPFAAICLFLLMSIVLTIVRLLESEAPATLMADTALQGLGTVGSHTEKPSFPAA